MCIINLQKNKWFFGISLRVPQLLTGIKHTIEQKQHPAVQTQSDFTKLPRNSEFQRIQGTK